jgi:hypothetical protein
MEYMNQVISNRKDRKYSLAWNLTILLKHTYWLEFTDINYVQITEN